MVPDNVSPVQPKERSVTLLDHFTHMEYASRYIAANGLHHHFLEWGDAGSPPVIMMHATGLASHSWLPIAEGLAARYRVMALDQRGHGDTGPSSCGYSFELVGQDLAAVIRALDLPRVRVVGHSSGGLATLIAAHLLPGRITQACLVETRVGERPANAPPGELRDRARRTRRKRMVWESREAMQCAYRQRAAFKDWDPRAFEAFMNGGVRLLSDGRAELKCPPEVEAQFYEKRESLQVAPSTRGCPAGFCCCWAVTPRPRPSPTRGSGVSSMKLMARR